MSVEDMAYLLFVLVFHDLPARAVIVPVRPILQRLWWRDLSIRQVDGVQEPRHVLWDTEVTKIAGVLVHDNCE